MMDMFKRCLFDGNLELSGFFKLVEILFVFEFSFVVESVKGVLVIFVTVSVLEMSVCKVAMIAMLKVFIMISLGLRMGQ